MSLRGILLGIAAGTLFAISASVAGLPTALLAFVAGVTASAALLFWVTDIEDDWEGDGPTDEDE